MTRSGMVRRGRRCGSGVCGKRGMDGDGRRTAADGGTDQAFDVPDIARLFRCRERDGPAFLSGARRASDAMHIVGGIVGKIEIDHHGNVRNVDAAGGDVRCDENAVLARFKTLQCFLPLRLRAIGVHLCRTVSHALHCTGDLARAVLGARKNEYASFLFLQDRSEERELFFPTDNEQLLFHLFGCGAGGRHFYAERRAHVSAREPQDLRRHGGGEEHRLPFLRYMTQDALNLRFESHVEHPVCFVQHEDLHFAERYGALFQVVIEAAGCCDENAGIPSQHLPLPLHGCAADEYGRVDTEFLRERMQCFFYLGCKLSCGKNDQRPPSVPEILE